MKYLELFEGADMDKPLNNLKDEFYLEAKKSYMNAIADALEEAGFKLEKMEMSSIVDNFKYDYFLCKFEGIKIKFSMSNTGQSLGVSEAASDAIMRGFTNTGGQYSVKVKSLLAKVKKHIERNK